MKNEMIKFVSENFDVINRRFLKSELEIIIECCEDEMGVINVTELNMLMEILLKQLEVSTAEELIEVINERSLGVDLNSDEAEELFDMIKAMKEATN
jgi:hypothetical protein